MIKIRSTVSVRRLKEALTSYIMKIIGAFVRGQREKRLYTNPNIKVAKSAKVLSYMYIKCGKSGMIKIGENTFINEMCSIVTWQSTIEIGNGVLIGPATIINTKDHNFKRTDIPIWKQGIIEKSIIIEDDVWIGANCTIVGGVRIGAHSVIGANSLVTDNIPPYSIAYGVPCKVTKTRELSSK